MKSSQLTHFISVFVLAVVSYFTFDFFAIELNNAYAIALGALLGGALVIVLSEFGGQETSEDSDDTTTLYVGNLAYKVNEHLVKDHFAHYGQVKSVRLMRDKKTGKRKGFGFVEVNSAAAQKMIKKLNDTEFFERTLKVRLAKERVSE